MSWKDNREHVLTWAAWSVGERLKRDAIFSYGHEFCNIEIEDRLAEIEATRDAMASVSRAGENAPTRAGILQEARALITGDRNKQYGEPVANHTDIAAGWSVLLDADVTAEQVALCMAWLKMCRTKTSPGKRDSYVDGAGYIAIAGECANAQ